MSNSQTRMHIKFHKLFIVVRLWPNLRQTSNYLYTSYSVLCTLLYYSMCHALSFGIVAYTKFCRLSGICRAGGYVFSLESLDSGIWVSK